MSDGTKSDIRLRDVTKTFWRGKDPVHVLTGLNVEIAAGDFVALMGPSGSGKTTLLNLITGLDRPTEGVVEIGGDNLGGLGESALARWRSQRIGFIFQSYNLLPVLTAKQNVELPLLLTKLSSAERRRRAETALKIVGLEDRQDHLPRQLSGGQEQRVTVARAIVNDPAIIVADEPTGDLDRKNAGDVMDLLERLNREFNKTIFMVTHDPLAAQRARRQLHIDKGVLTDRDVAA